MDGVSDQDTINELHQRINATTDFLRKLRDWELGSMTFEMYAQGIDDFLSSLDTPPIAKTMPVDIDLTTQLCNALLREVGLRSDLDKSKEQESHWYSELSKAIVGKADVEIQRDALQSRLDLATGFNQRWLDMFSGGIRSGELTALWNETAQSAGDSKPVESNEAVQFTAVAVLRDDGDGGLDPKWLLEGGTAELLEGMYLLVADNGQVCEEDGHAELFIHPAAPSDTGDLIAALKRARIALAIAKYQISREMPGHSWLAGYARGINSIDQALAGAGISEHIDAVLSDTVTISEDIPEVSSDSELDPALELIKEAWRLLDGQDPKTAEWHVAASYYLTHVSPKKAKGPESGR